MRANGKALAFPRSFRIWNSFFFLILSLFLLTLLGWFISIWRWVKWLFRCTIRSRWSRPTARIATVRPTSFTFVLVYDRERIIEFHFLFFFHLNGQSANCLWECCRRKSARTTCGSCSALTDPSRSAPSSATTTTSAEVFLSFLFFFFFFFPPFSFDYLFLFWLFFIWLNPLVPATLFSPVWFQSTSN